MADDIRALGPEYCTNTWLLLQNPSEPDVLRFFSYGNEKKWFPLFIISVTAFVDCLLGQSDSVTWPKGMSLLFLYDFSQTMLQLVANMDNNRRS